MLCLFFKVSILSAENQRFSALRSFLELPIAIGANIYNNPDSYRGDLLYGCCVYFLRYPFFRLKTRGFQRSGQFLETPIAIGANIYNNFCRMRGGFGLVVICFQFLEIPIFTTTCSSGFSAIWLLWFAFSSLKFRYLQQHIGFIWSITPGCDLLSVPWNSDIYNNRLTQTRRFVYVVICFQFLEIPIFTTTVICFTEVSLVLWFAFSSLKFRYLQQQVTSKNRFHYCCDLLSVPWNSDIYNNSSAFGTPKIHVVICFQFLEIPIFTTTRWR